MSDTYVIDESVARSDISKMNQAIQRLKNARHAIAQLITCAESMSGQTGSAIVEKSKELQQRTDRLIRSLQTSIALLEKTIIHYQNVDDAHAWHIRG